ncbi:MAG: CHASE2 domain-containing protein [Terriglobales bacterium]
MGVASPASEGIFAQLRGKGIVHWLIVLVLTALGTWIGHWISQKQVWVDVRYWIYQKTFDAARVRGPLYPKRTALVLIGDEEYWKGELGGRAPIKRDYLAKLVEKLDAADAAVIALDFDLRSPVPDGSMIEHPDYRAETERLSQTLKNVASRRPVVLPATVGFDAKGYYVERPTIFSGFDFGEARVHKGYLQLPYDLRRTPVALELASGEMLDSFALAMVGAVDATARQRIATQEMDALPFASYMTESDFAGTTPEDAKLFSSSAILNGDPAALRKNLGARIVIVGGAWSSAAYGTGKRVDIHPSPAGTMPGVFLHANYVEAILNDRTYRPLSENLVMALEIALVLGVAVILALNMRTLRKFALVSAVCVGFVFVSYFFLQNLGMFFDFFVPVAVLSGHLIVEKVVHWRKHARYNSGPLPPQGTH